MSNPLVVPLDGSPLAERALPFADRLSRATGAAVVLVRAAWDPSSAVVTNAAAHRIAHARLETLAAEARSYLAAVAARRAVDQLPTRTSVHLGAPALAVIEEARTQQAELIVMTTHGRTGPGRLLFGSVAEDILRQAQVPVLLIPARAAEWPAERTLRILLTLDGSAYAEEAIPAAVHLATGLAADLRLLRVVDGAEDLGEARRYLTDVVAHLPQDLVHEKPEALVGSPDTDIARSARAMQADVIAMATHGRTGLTRLVMGSVTSATLRAASTPVLVVRPQWMGEASRE